MMRSVWAFFFIGLLSLQGSEPRIGAYFFNDWPLYPERGSIDFPDREPLWGYTEGTLGNMERQIGLAADAGLAFWSFCWYAPEDPPQNWRGRTGLTFRNHPLNDGLRLFREAGNRERLQYTLLVANHFPYSTTPEQWDELTAAWVEMMQDPNYLRAGGRPLITFYSGKDLLEKFGGPEPLAAALGRFREAARAAGLPGVTIAVCSHQPDADLEAAGFDAYTGYHYRWMMAGAEWGREHPFAELAEAHRRSWEGYPAGETKLPVIPLLAVGWDDRARAREERRGRYFWWVEEPTPAELFDHLREFLGWMQSHPERCFPDPLGVVYAWNELGEGGYLVPTKGKDNRFLGAVAAALADDRGVAAGPDGRVAVELPGGRELGVPEGWLRIDPGGDGPMGEADRWDTDFSVVYVPEEGWRTLLRAVAPLEENFASVDVRIRRGLPETVDAVLGDVRKRLVAENLKFIEEVSRKVFPPEAGGGFRLEYLRTGRAGPVRVTLVEYAAGDATVRVRISENPEGVEEDAILRPSD